VCKLPAGQPNGDWLPEGEGEGDLHSTGWLHGSWPRLLLLGGASGGMTNHLASPLARLNKHNATNHRWISGLL
jgi:hypothetical protein